MDSQLTAKQRIDRYLAVKKAIKHPPDFSVTPNTTPEAVAERMKSWADKLVDLCRERDELKCDPIVRQYLVDRRAAKRAQKAELAQLERQALAQVNERQEKLQVVAGVSGLVLSIAYIAFAIAAFGAMNFFFNPLWFLFPK